jgi:hypothetical protein
MERAYRIRTHTIIDSATGSLMTTLGPSCDRRDMKTAALAAAPHRKPRASGTQARGWHPATGS